MNLKPRSPDARVEINMTPLIDVVFQLLIFFILSFRIVDQEGDLAIKMPSEHVGGESVDHPDLPPLAVRLVAGPAGELAEIRLPSEKLAGTDELRSRVAGIVANYPELEVDLHCDASLKYEHAVAALTAVSGHRAGGDVTPLARHVRLMR
jgi:biopolymer transport protein ExbD